MERISRAKVSLDTVEVIVDVVRVTIGMVKVSTDTVRVTVDSTLFPTLREIPEKYCPRDDRIHADCDDLFFKVEENL